MSPLSILLPLVKNVILSESGEKYAPIKHCLQVKNPKQFWCERTTDDGLFHWRKRYGFFRLKSDGLKLEQLMDFFLLLTNMQLFASRDVNWWNGVWITWGLLWCFLSAVWTLILTAPIHCRVSIGEQVMWFYISPNLLPLIKKRVIF